MNYLYHTQAYSVDSFKEAMAKGPLPLAINANNDAFKYYDSGIINSGCSIDLDHVVVAAGWGIDEKGMEYVLIMNSWGTDWGDKGFIKIRSNANVCGINDWASYPLVA